MFAARLSSALQSAMEPADAHLARVGETSLACHSAGMRPVSLSIQFSMLPSSNTVSIDVLRLQFACHGIFWRHRHRRPN
jgi:hypothetical protein